MASILADIGTKVGEELKALSDRVTTLEGTVPAPTGPFTVSPVTWTNLTEINLSGEKLINGDFSNLSSNIPTNWSVSSSVQLDQDKLSQGIVKGDGGAVSIQQIFSNPIASGTKLVAKVTRADNNENGEVRVQTLRSNGQSFGTNKNISYADGFVEFETTETTYGLRLSTAHGTREVSSISLFQGIVSGGTVQANGNGGLEKIAGVGGWNSGASSSTSLDGNSNGYVQFQWGSEFKSQRVGFTYLDEGYSAIEPFMLVINGSGQVYTNGLNNFNQSDFSEVGDFFRIRHYASTNQIHFQKRQIVYSQNADFVLETASGSNYNYPEPQRPLVIALDGTGNLTIGEYYKIYTVRDNDQAVYLRDLNGEAKGWHGGSTRGSRYEVVEELGEDYVTFHIHSTLTNGNNLFVDTSLYHVGSQLNDVLFAKQDNS